MSNSVYGRLIFIHTVRRVRTVRIWGSEMFSIWIDLVQMFSLFYSLLRLGYCYFAKETIQSRKNQVGSCHKDNRLASSRFSEQCTTAFFNLYQNNCFCKTKAPRNNTQKVNIRVEWSKSTQIHWIDPLVKGQKDDDR